MSEPRRFNTFVDKEIKRKARVRDIDHTKPYNEPTVAKWYKQSAEADGGLVMKMHPITNAGIPDLITFRRGRVFFVETKSTGDRCTPLQIEMHRRLKERGIDTYVLDTKIDNFSDLFLYAYTTYEGRHYHKNPFKD